MAQYRNVKEFTDKIRKAYSKYREEYVNISNALIDDKKKWSEELRRGWINHRDCQEATNEHNKKARELREAFESIEERAKAEFDEIKSECMKIFEPYNRATASMLDIPTLELLKSGILKDNELMELAEDFADNVTMQRLIGKYAEERAKISDTTDGKMKIFAVNCQSASFPYIEPVDALIMWSLKAIRGEKDKNNKEDAIHMSHGIANVYDEQADKITADAEKFYIKVGE